MSKNIEVGDLILINTDPYGVCEQWNIEAKVVDLLSVQFTAKYTNGTDTLTFQFYNDEGSIWRKK